jgi:hypothetical protein
MTCVDGGELEARSWSQSAEGIADSLEAAAVVAAEVVQDATVVPLGEAAADLGEAAVVATCSVQVDDIVVVGGHSPAFGLRLSIGLRRTAGGRVRETAGLRKGQVAPTAGRGGYYFAYVAPQIGDSQCIGHVHHHLRSSSHGFGSIRWASPTVLCLTAKC